MTDLVNASSEDKRRRISERLDSAMSDMLASADLA
jgi:hypothetical protein